MIDVVLLGFFACMMLLGLRRPFLWVLVYIYVDVVAPQKVGYTFLSSLQISLVAFLAAFGGWALLDSKQGMRFNSRQLLLAALLAYCGYTTLQADFPVNAMEKWSWVWKAMIFAMFLPLTLTTRLRIEGALLVLLLSLAAIVINGGIKTVTGGGGYGVLSLLVRDNTGLYEGSIISTMAVAAIPLILWMMKHGTIFPPDWRVKWFGIGFIFSCLLMPIGTSARTGLVAVAVLAVMMLRQVKRPFLYIAAAGMALVVSIPFLPASFTERMSTIDSYQADQSASTRVAVWKWTLDYVEDHPMGGGFDAYRGNEVSYYTRLEVTRGNTTRFEKTEIVEKSRAYHSSYFEVLGEQGWPGLFLWLALHGSGLWQMEKLRRRWKRRVPDGWQWPLATALQQVGIIYLVGSLFVGIAFQPFILLVIGLQIGLYSYLARIEKEAGGGARGAGRAGRLGAGSRPPRAVGAAPQRLHRRPNRA